jgi:hypothetical protein
VIVVDWHVPRVTRSSSLIDDILSWKWSDAIVREVKAVDSHYDRSVEAAAQVGKEIARWMKEKGIAPSRTVISGHSLGAQIAAFASNTCALPEFCNEPVSIILAADPAGPKFANRPPEARLSQDDAGRVIVVHATGILGDQNPIGTVDIYVSWPASSQSDPIWQHSEARELITSSFLQPKMSNTDGTPFGANALGFDFSDGKRREYQPGAASAADLAAIVRR